MAYVVKIVLVLSRLIFFCEASPAAVVPGLNDLQTHQAELLTMKVDEGNDFLQQPNQDPIIGRWVNASSSDSAPANISFLPSGLFGGIWQNTSRRFASPFACQRAAFGTSAYMCYLTDAGTLYANITDFQMTFSDGSRWNRLTTTSTTTSTTATSTTATSTTATSSTTTSTTKKETEPTQNLVAWYDASNNPTTSGRWMDLSGNGYDLTATGPAAGSTTIAGRPALDFSSGQRYSRSSVPLSSNDVTVIMVVTTASGSWPNWASYMHHGNRDTDWAMEHNAWGSNFLHFQSQNDNSGNQVQIQLNTNYIFVGTYASRVRSLTVYSTSGTQLATSTATDSWNSLRQGSKTLYVGSSDVGEQSKAKFGEILYYQRALSASEIASQVLRLSNKWSRDATVPNQNLVAWYDASNNPTTSRLTDLSGNGYDLTPVGSAAGSTTINGRPALDLSGGQKYSRPGVPLSSYDLTVIMVLTTASGSQGWGRWWSKYMQHGDKDWDWQMGQHDGRVYFRSQNNPGNEVQTSLNTQYIFVGTYASRVRSITVYSMSGQHLGTRTVTDASYSLTHGSKMFYVGGADMGESCKGNLGEILYYQRALTTAEIASQVSRLSKKWNR